MISFREFVAQLNADDSEGMQDLIAVTHSAPVGATTGVRYDDLDGLLQGLREAIDRNDMTTVRTAGEALAQLVTDYEVEADMESQS